MTTIMLTSKPASMTPTKHTRFTRANAACCRIRTLFTVFDGERYQFKTHDHRLLYEVLRQAMADLGDPAQHDEAKRYITESTTYWIADTCQRLGLFEVPPPEKYAQLQAAERKKSLAAKIRTMQSKLAHMEAQP